MAAGEASTLALGSRQFDDDDDDDAEDDGVDAFSKEELARRPEVRFIDTYAVIRAYVILVLKGLGALLLLWATVVLLGGFVSSLNKTDFWFISFISFVQAAGVFNAMLDNQLKPMEMWDDDASAVSSRVKHDHVDTQQHRAPCARRASSCLKTITKFLVTVVVRYVLAFCLGGPYACAVLSIARLTMPEYRHAYQDNLKRGIDLFYILCAVQGLMSVLILALFEKHSGTHMMVVKKVSDQVGLSIGIVGKYCNATNLKYLSNPASFEEDWNLITYGAGLLDSEMPEDNVSGARVLGTLIEQGVPVRPLLLRSPRHRIQNLIGALAWTSPAEGEMRWLVARIVAHVAPDLSLAHFPGALECISSLLLDTSSSNKLEGTYFAAQLRLVKQQDKQKSKSSSLENKVVKLIRRLIHGGEKEQVSIISSVEGTNEDLIVQGLRILERLALNEHNCKVICSSEALLSKIFAPVSSKNLVEDIKANTAWGKVTDGSLKLLSRLIRCPGDTGKEMRRRVADNSCAVKNLEDVLALEINSCNIIVVLLQIRAVEILEQLCSGESTYTNDSAKKRRKTLFMKFLHILLTDKWMEDYISKAQQSGQPLAEDKMKEAEETVRQLKEKAGEALAKLCMGNKINAEEITSFTGCANVVHYLTEMLDSDERSIRCRFSAAVILKHLCTNCTSTLDNSHLKETTLKKVLKELLHIKTGTKATSTNRWSQLWHCISQGGNDIEKQGGGGGHGEHPHVSVLGHKQQHEERRLHVALLSLCAAIREKCIDAPDFAGVVAQLACPEDSAEKLKKLVEANRYATPTCLAALKLICGIVIALIPYDHGSGEVKMKDVVDSLEQASKTMAGLESCMLFAGTDRDCYGLPVKPFCSVLVEDARKHLEQTT